MSRTILVTGATGNVGRHVVAELVTAGHRVRTLMRDPRPIPGAVAVYGDLSRPATLATALEGVDAVFLMWPLRDAEPFVPALRAMAGAGVVYLGSGAVPGLPMAEQATLVAAATDEWTVIRPSTFAVNALWWAGQIRAGDEVRGAYGELAMPMLHERGIAAVAVRALTGTALGVLDLTGPHPLSQAEQVRQLGAAIGRQLRWVELATPEARAQLLRDGLPRSFADVLLGTYAGMVATPPMPVTSTVADVLGRPALTFREWAAEHADAFRADPTLSA